MPRDLIGPFGRQVNFCGGCVGGGFLLIFSRIIRAGDVGTCDLESFQIGAFKIRRLANQMQAGSQSKKKHQFRNLPYMPVNAFQGHQ